MYAYTHCSMYVEFNVTHLNAIIPNNIVISLKCKIFWYPHNTHIPMPKFVECIHAYMQYTAYTEKKNDHHPEYNICYGKWILYISKAVQTFYPTFRLSLVFNIGREKSIKLYIALYTHILYVYTYSRCRLFSVLSHSPDAPVLIYGVLYVATCNINLPLSRSFADVALHTDSIHLVSFFLFIIIIMPVSRCYMHVTHNMYLYIAHRNS